MAKRKVLMTGAAGYIASQLLKTFRDEYDLTLIDVRDTDRDGNPVPGMQIADLTDGDLEANREFFRGQDTVVHLGYIHPPSGQGSNGIVSYRTERTNVDMAWNVYQLAYEEGLRRVVMASSNHAADWYEHLIHAKKKDVVDPWERAVSDNYYGWAKEAYEHLGFVFAAGRLGKQLEVVQIRIGAPREIDVAAFGGDRVAMNRNLGAHISERDLQQLFARSIEADDIRDEHGIPFQIFYGISGNTRAFWSIANAREVIGYDPQDDSESKYAADIAQHLTNDAALVPTRQWSPGPEG